MEDKLTKHLIDSLKKGRSVYDKIIKNTGFHVFKLWINCEDLVERDNIHDAKSRKYDLPESLKVSFFRPFDLLIKSINTKSCLYIFEFQDILAKDVYEAYINMENKERNKSGFKNNPDFDTNVLYVGKVKKDLGGRISTHFGYAHSKTGGLQLKYWAKNLKLKLIIHMIVFDENIGNFINPLELELTKTLKPLIGKSK